MKFLKLKDSDKQLLQTTGHVCLTFESKVPKFCDQEMISFLDLPLVYVQSDGVIVDNCSTLREYWVGNSGKDILVRVNKRSFPSEQITVLGNGGLCKFEVDNVGELLKGFAHCLDLKKLGEHYLPPRDNSRVFVCSSVLIATLGDQQVWMGARLYELKKNPKPLY